MSHPHEYAPVGLPTRDSNRPAAPVRVIDTRFLSVTLDYACLLGAPWWEGTRRTRHSFGEKPATPVDLDNLALRRYARALAPAYLRLGGSESDRVRYAVGDAATAARSAPDRKRSPARSNRKPGLAVSVAARSTKKASRPAVVFNEVFPPRSYRCVCPHQ
mgnify:CR=1 FL=1